MRQFMALLLTCILPINGLPVPSPAQIGNESVSFASKPWAQPNGLAPWPGPPETYSAAGVLASKAPNPRLVALPSIPAATSSADSAAAPVLLPPAPANPTNQPPAADAGPDQTVGCAGPNAPNAFLNAMGSSDPDGDALAYEWRKDGAVLASTPTVNLTLKAGVHEITLTVTDFWDSSDSDTLTVTVEAECDGTTVVVDENVLVDFNVSPPVCTDGATSDLCQFVSYHQPAGTSANEWKTIFDLGSKSLVVNSAVKVRTQYVPASGSQRKAPGLEIRSTCSVEVQNTGSIIVESVNDLAGDVLVQGDKGVNILGSVENELEGELGRSGNITIASCCGDVTIGPQARVQTWNGDLGGRDINLLACCGGDVNVNGEVTAVHSRGTPPTINVSALFGAVTINATNDFGEKTYGGALTRRMSGLFVATFNEPGAGQINIQARKDVTLLGNRQINFLRGQTTAAHVRPFSNDGLGGDGRYSHRFVGRKHQRLGPVALCYYEI